MKSTTAFAVWGTVLLGSAACVTETHRHRSPALRTDAWYRDSVVNIHFDNHSNLLAKDVSPGELASMFADVPVTMIQVSGQNNLRATYPTPSPGTNNPAANGYDTLAAFKRVTRQQGQETLRLHVGRPPSAGHQGSPGMGRAIGADSTPEINGEPIVCQRPHRDGKGYLTERFIPQVREIIRLYDPEGFWFDGDYILPRPCWCPRCLVGGKPTRGWMPRANRTIPAQALDRVASGRIPRLSPCGGGRHPRGQSQGTLYQQLVVGVDARGLHRCSRRSAATPGTSGRCIPCSALGRAEEALRHHELLHGEARSWPPPARDTGTRSSARFRKVH